MTALINQNELSRSFRIAPIPGAKKRYRIERQDYSDSLFWDTKPEPATGLR
jgi:hypothetical protein